MAPFRNSPVNIFLSAGETSGDLHGSYLVRALQARQAGVRVTCLGGPLLHQAGARVLVDNRDLAVVGLFEVLNHAKVVYNAWQRIKAHILQDRPHLMILIDFPDFNMRLARLARRLGVRVFYYISPQVWAWRAGRVHALKRLVDQMAVILPFESDFYSRYGMKTHYVGHPLLDVLKEVPSTEASRSRYRPGHSGSVVGLLPGSRLGEIRSLLSTLLETAAVLSRQMPELSFLLPVAANLPAEEIAAQAAQWHLPLQIVRGDTHGAIRAADLLLTTSGTVTLEAAILGTPMIIVYRVSNLTYYAGRHLIKVQHVGLPNLIAGRSIVPELLQQEATAQRIAAAALRCLREPALLERQRRELAHIRRQLGEPGVAMRVAELALQGLEAGELAAR